MNKIYIAIIFLSSLIAQTKSLTIDKSFSFVEYEGSHFLHNWVGKSQAINGTIIIDDDNPAKSTNQVAIPVFSFDSNNGNRDSNMLLYVEEFLFPEVKFNSTSIIQVSESVYKLTGKMNFHGVEKEVIIPVEVNIDRDFIYFKSAFNVNITDYNVERPKLLLTPIDEMIEIRIQLRGTLKN